MNVCLEKLISIDRPSSVKPRRWISADCDVAGLRNCTSAWSYQPTMSNNDFDMSLQHAKLNRVRVKAYRVVVELLDADDVPITGKQIEQVVARYVLAQTADQEHGRDGFATRGSRRRDCERIYWAQLCNICFLLRRRRQLGVREIFCARAILLHDQLLLLKQERRTSYAEK